MPKVIWPTRDELRDSTIVVIIMASDHGFIGSWTILTRCCVLGPEAAVPRRLTTPEGNEMAKQWYVIHTYSGHENKVKTNLEKAIHSAGLEDAFRPDPRGDRGFRRDEGRQAHDLEAQDVSVVRAWSRWT